MRLSVIVPMYNEAKKIENSLLLYNEYLSRQNYSYEIIVVDDGSGDKSREIVKSLQKKIKPLRLMENSKNQGKGAAVCKGLKNSRGKYRLFLDADNSTSIEHLDLVWPKIKTGYEVVIGSRNPRDAKKAEIIAGQPAWKRFFGIAGNRLFQAFILKGIYDTQCGFKVVSNKATAKIIPKMRLKRWAFDIEMLKLAQMNNFKIAKIPVRWINSPETKVGVSGYASSLSELIKLKINLILKKYQ